jgi:hypothetical protein
VHLISLGRTITIPDPITLDDTPPTLTVTSAPGAIPVRYTTSEPAAVFAHARELSGSSARGAVFRGRGGKVRLHHSPLAGAEVGMTLVAVDRAGNTSVPVSVGTIRLPG